MKGEIRASISAIAAAVMIVGCASKAPESPTGETAAVAANPDKTSAEYQRLIDNASNQRVCKRQAVTGSRVDTMVCMTRAEMEEQQANADRIMREMRDSAASRQQIPDRPPMPPPTATPSGP